MFHKDINIKGKQHNLCVYMGNHEIPSFIETFEEWEDGDLDKVANCGFILHEEGGEATLWGIGMSTGEDSSLDADGELEFDLWCDGINVKEDDIFAINSVLENDHLRKSLEVIDEAARSKLTPS